MSLYSITLYKTKERYIVECETIQDENGDQILKDDSNYKASYFSFEITQLNDEEKYDLHPLTGNLGDFLTDGTPPLFKIELCTTEDNLKNALTAYLINRFKLIHSLNYKMANTQSDQITQDDDKTTVSTDLNEFEKNVQSKKMGKLNAEFYQLKGNATDQTEVAQIKTLPSEDFLDATDEKIVFVLEKTFHDAHLLYGQHFAMTATALVCIVANNKIYTANLGGSIACLSQKSKNTDDSDNSDSDSSGSGSSKDSATVAVKRKDTFELARINTPNNTIASRVVSGEKHWANNHSLGGLIYETLSNDNSTLTSSPGANKTTSRTIHRKPEILITDLSQYDENETELILASYGVYCVKLEEKVSQPNSNSPTRATTGNSNIFLTSHRGRTLEPQNQTHSRSLSRLKIPRSITDHLKKMMWSSDSISDWANKALNKHHSPYNITLIRAKLNTPQNTPAMYAIFSGNNGTQVVQTLQQHFYELFMANLKNTPQITKHTEKEKTFRPGTLAFSGNTNLSLTDPNFPAYPQRHSLKINLSSNSNPPSLPNRKKSHTQAYSPTADQKQESGQGIPKKISWKIDLETIGDIFLVKARNVSTHETLYFQAKIKRDGDQINLTEKTEDFYKSAKLDQDDIIEVGENLSSSPPISETPKNLQSITVNLSNQTMNKEYIQSCLLIKNIKTAQLTDDDDNTEIIPRKTIRLITPKSFHYQPTEPSSKSTSQTQLSPPPHTSPSRTESSKIRDLLMTIKTIAENDEKDATSKKGGWHNGLKKTKPLFSNIEKDNEFKLSNHWQMIKKIFGDHANGFGGLTRYTAKSKTFPCSHKRKDEIDLVYRAIADFDSLDKLSKGEISSFVLLIDTQLKLDLVEVIKKEIERLENSYLGADPTPKILSLNAIRGELLDHISNPKKIKSTFEEVVTTVGRLYPCYDPNKKMTSLTDENKNPNGIRLPNEPTRSATVNEILAWKRSANAKESDVAKSMENLQQAVENLKALRANCLKIAGINEHTKQKLYQSPT